MTAAPLRAATEGFAGRAPPVPPATTRPVGSRTVRSDRTRAARMVQEPVRRSAQATTKFVPSNPMLG
jgi:hypothetical protein